MRATVLVIAMCGVVACTQAPAASERDSKSGCRVSGTVVHAGVGPRTVPARGARYFVGRYVDGHYDDEKIVGAGLEVSTDGRFETEIVTPRAFLLISADGYEPQWFGPLVCGERVHAQLAAAAPAPLLATMVLRGQLDEELFRIDVHVDGLVEWQGSPDMPLHGRASHRVSPAEVDALRRAFAQADFAHLPRAVVCDEVSDNDAVVGLTEYVDGGTIRVGHALACRSGSDAERMAALEIAFEQRSGYSSAFRGGAERTCEQAERQPDGGCQWW